jgi:uncharacterized repeat protein (TIGR03803 family)
VLHSFNSAQDSTDGIIPDGSLIQSGSILYGTTSGSAHPVRSPYYAGTIFQYDLTTDAESVLYTSQQYSPVGSVIQSGPNLYGVQGGPFGGGGGGYGMIFQYNLAAGTETVLHSFVGGPGDGNYPGASLIQSGSVLYGVTSAGGAIGEGAIFEYDLATNTESLVYSFAGGTADGAGPEGSLIQFGSVLYGMTYGGGADGFGAIFQFNLTTDAESVLHSFAGGTGDGENSQLNCSLILSGSTLYGMTPQGGTGKDGVIFSLTVPEPAMGSMLLITGAAMLMQRKRE